MSARQPNILYLLADDLGWGDVGFHGSRIATPALDRLAATGVELTQHYVCPMCTPTRASLLTGRYPGRFGQHATVPSNPPVLPDGYPTLAGVLGQAGYETGLFGKWHLGSDPQFGPNRFGFDHAYGSLAGGVDPYNHHYKRGPWSRTWHRNGEFVEERGHVTDLLAAEAERWILARSNDRPWFAYVPFTAVHVPIKTPQAWLDRYAGTTYDADGDRDRSFKAYAGYTSQMDYAVGRLIEALTVSGQLDDTLVVFSSDNGAIPECDYRGVEPYPGRQTPAPLLGSNLPFRGRKAQLYEGGIRTPTIVNWPGRLAPRRMGLPVAVADWMPTLLHLAGAEPKRDPKWDGVNIWPLIDGTAETIGERDLFWNFRGDRFALRRGPWKLIARGEEPQADSCELYQVQTDPGEAHDRAAQRPDLVAELLAGIADHRRRDGEDQRPDI